jgi:hypothetical protein
MQILGDKLNLFAKTRYSLSEEDRIVNGLLILLKHGPSSFISGFMNYIGTPIDRRDNLILQDHITCAPDSKIDGEILIPGKLRIFLEAKIYSDKFADSNQIERYFRILKGKTEARRTLLLVSPDLNEPSIVSEIPGQYEFCFIRWRSWQQIDRLVARHLETFNEEYPIAEFLFSSH